MVTLLLLGLLSVSDGVQFAEVRTTSTKLKTYRTKTNVSCSK